MDQNEFIEVVVITGASAGVGRATAEQFAKTKRYRIALLARGLEGLEGAKEEVESHGSEAMVIQTDISDPEQVEKAAQMVEKLWGCIDIWVNCAMITVLGEFDEITDEEYRRVTEVTYLGYVYGTHAALKRMLPENRGVIIQVGSALCYRSIPLQSAYCGAKHGIKGFTESLICELMYKKSNVRVTMVHLPAVNTPQFEWSRNKMKRKHQPVPPIYQPELCARAIVWSAYAKRRETFVGTAPQAVWLNKFVPSIVDRFLAKTGYDSQQYDGEVEKDKPDNIWGPLRKDFGARGPFSDRSISSSKQLQITMLPGYPHILWAGVGLSIFAIRRLYKLWCSGKNGSVEKCFFDCD